MSDPKLFQVVNRLMCESMKLQIGERVCVVTDTERLPLAEIFTSVASKLDTDPIMVVMTPRAQHGSEVPAMVAATMKEADAVFQIVTHAMTHTDATRDALQAGSRVLVLRGITEDLMLFGAINADYQEIAATCLLVSNLMRDAKQAHISTKKGTNLIMTLDGRLPHILDGIVKGPGTFAAMPDGEIAISPVEKTTEGVLVIEHSMDGLGLLDEPIYLDVAEGLAVSIKGGRSAEKLRRLIDEADEGANNIAEFAIGANPQARLIGNLAEDKKLEGSVHIAVGDNHVLGGKVTSNIHLDGMLLNPTVKLDGKLVVDQGTLLLI
jgi:leucyl aminopeptidase (aminopeptidase T)|tara:strand:- start:13021 stop:13986 length:966 start_codon:yes stop_codon:yes gene_type:complete